MCKRSSPPWRSSLGLPEEASPNTLSGTEQCPQDMGLLLKTLKTHPSSPKCARRSAAAAQCLIQAHLAALYQIYCTAIMSDLKAEGVTALEDLCVPPELILGSLWGATITFYRQKAEGASNAPNALVLLLGLRRGLELTFQHSTARLLLTAELPPHIPPAPPVRGSWTPNSLRLWPFSTNYFDAAAAAFSSCGRGMCFPIFSFTPVAAACQSLPQSRISFSDGYSSCFQEDLEYVSHIPVDPLVSLQGLRDGHCSTALICYMPGAVLPNCTDPLVALTDRSHRAAFCALHSTNPHSLTTNPHIQSKHTPEIRT